MWKDRPEHRGAVVQDFSCFLGLNFWSSVVLSDTCACLDNIFMLLGAAVFQMHLSAESIQVPTHTRKCGCNYSLFLNIQISFLFTKLKMIELNITVEITYTIFSVCVRVEVCYV